MFQQFLDGWNEFLSQPDPEILSRILHDDVVFHSPVVFTPQRGKKITILYLMGAAMVFGDGFSYRKKIISGHQGALEFVADIDGITVEGVDIVTVNDDGLVTEFKVMIRPLKAILAVQEKMKKILPEVQGK